MQDLIQQLASELDKDPRHVENVVRLLDEGNTIPFIARYRKELHGAMDDTALRNLEERLQYLRNLAERREAVKRSIEEQGKLTEELSAAIDAARTLAEEGVSVRVVDMHTIKPLDYELVLKAALETRCIVTAEEHTVIGGLGSAVAEFLAEHCPVPVLRHGVHDEFGRSGKAQAVLEAYGLTPAGIADQVRQALKRKP